MTIGILGGVASGKSTVARLLAEHGAVVLDADAEAHAVLEDPEVRSSLLARWGEAILGPDRRIDRSQIAKRVFASSPAAEQERRFLEGLIHPRVRQNLLARRDVVATGGAELGPQVVVLDVPLLFEAGWLEDCDLVVFVDATDGFRRQQAEKRGWTAQDLADREAAQAPMQQKRAAAHVSLQNPGTLEGLRGEVGRLWQSRVVPLIGVLPPK